MSDQYLFLDAAFVKAEVGKLLAEYPELQDDEELRADAIEGETDAHKIIARALEARNEAASIYQALDIRIDLLSQRRARFERKADAMKSLIRNIMRAANLQKLTLPEATLSILAPRQTVGIEDLDALPQGYFKTIRQADKDAIKQALAGGAEIPGAILVTGSSGLMIRTK